MNPERLDDLAGPRAATEDGLYRAPRSLARRVSAVTVLNLVLTSAIYLLIVLRLGANASTDAYYLSLSIPSLIAGVAGGSIVSAAVPVLAVEQAQARRVSTWALLVGVLSLVSVVLLALTLAAPIVAAALGPGLSDREVELTSRLLRINLLGTVFNVALAVLTSYCHASRSFLLPELSVLSGNLVFLGGLWFFLGDSVEPAAWLSVLSLALPAAFLAVKLGLPPARLSIVAVVRPVLGRASPLLALNGFQQAEVVLERSLASLGGPGAVALFSLARQVVAAIGLVLNKAFASPFLPEVALAARRGHARLVWRRCTEVTRRVLAWSAVTVLTIALFGPVVVDQVGARSDLDVRDVRSGWHLLLLLSLAAVCAGVGGVFAVAFYGRGDTRTPAKIGLVGFGAGVLARLLGFAVAGLAGMAVGVSLHYALNVALMVAALSLKLRGGPLGGWGSLPDER